MRRFLETVGFAAERTVAGTKATKEWMGRGWVLPLIAVHVGLQYLGYKLVGHNERLHDDLMVAPNVSFIGGVLLGGLVDKLFPGKEWAEKAVMVGAMGGVTLAGAYTALAIRGDGNLDGMQTGVGAIPAAEGAFLLASSAPSAALGVVTGEALYRDSTRRP